MSTRPKGLLLANGQLAPVANKPLVLYGLDAMRSAGVREVGILADPGASDAIRSLVGEELGRGMRVRYLSRPAGAEAGEWLAAAAPFLSDSPCVVQLRDGLMRGDVRPLVD